MKSLDDILQEAQSEQLLLATKVLTTDDPRVSESIVIGVDVAYRDETAFACAVSIDMSKKEIVDTKRISVTCEFPYISGYFYLREGPIILKLLEEMKLTGPVLIDGNGILHPRRFGLASYIGIKLDIPTIGVAKTLSIGTVGERKQNHAPITLQDELVGMALWFESNKKPIYISVGHRISLETAVRVVETVSSHGVPEPIRQAHLCSKRWDRDEMTLIPPSTIK